MRRFTRKPTYSPLFAPKTARSVAGALGLLLMLGLVAGCTPDEEVPLEEGMVDTTAATDTAAAEAWTVLFDGENLSAWRGYAQEEIPENWQITDDGALFFDPDAGEGGDIMTVEEYGDFELALEWRVSEGGNSGIIYRVEDEGYDYPWQTGPEFQILDNEGHPDAENGPDRTAGANYALHAPSSDVTSPVGEWNEARIVARGPHVEHWLNGEMVVEYELWSDEWEERVAASKFTEMPDYGQYEEGHIALQDHGNEVWFRNIRIRPLSETTADTSQTEASE